MVGSEANQRGHGWLSTTHQNKSKEHPQAAVTPRKQIVPVNSGCKLRKRFYRTSRRVVVKRDMMSRYQTKSHCGFATRSRKEAEQQGESSYGKNQLLSDRSRQKRVSTKPVNPSEESIETAPPFLHLSNAPLTRRLIPTSDYNLVRATTTRHVTTGKETEHIVGGNGECRLTYRRSGLRVETQH